MILNEDGTWHWDIEINEKPKTTTIDNCDKITEFSTDKVTGNKTQVSKETLMISKDGKKGILIYAIRSKGLILSMQAYGASSCIDEKAKVNVLFRDGSRLELLNDGKFNCDKDFTFYFGGVFGKTNELDALRTKEIETIRAWTRDGFVEEDLTVQNSVLLMQTIGCLTN